MSINMFDAFNEVRRVVESNGATVERSKRYRQRPAIQVSAPQSLPVDGTIEITVCTDGLIRRVHAARINGCTVYWE
ncbi:MULTISPECIES: hypothetical protein [Hafnia]|uniref:hypothetical protein n=1 Tax=Hafnia TaxID=568 RepID=UPI001436FCB8|nr:hypothetical protein [Hafnia paralvei]MBU2673540.1 hypothetical protein [Hafnia paralvei]QHJ80018.1 MAG: hypothetical protein [Caudoviricetes sp.]